MIANLKKDFIPNKDDPPDASVKFDQVETIQVITSASEADGHVVHFCAGDHMLPQTFASLQPQISFNIAESIMEDGREAQVPAL